MLKRLIESLQRQQTGNALTSNIVVADNDASRSAEPVVSELALTSRIPIVYCHEPRQNIALVRNKAVANATGDFIAFIDDDEFPGDNWLLNLVAACDKYRASGILGPVRPHFDTAPPRWIIQGGFCERPEPPTGTLMDWTKSRTGNVLFRRAILANVAEPFKEEFGTGGEDKDFFMRMTQGGATFYWCNEAPVYESVPPSRWTRRYMLSRAMLRGRNVLKHPEGRIKLVSQSFIAVPIYSLILPITLVFGQYVFMKYCIKFCDHAGRILALFGMNPVRERQM